ncbi:hypothetical protein [Kitasatospora sp. NBC_00315]|uniref:hypothetical protein n=1 Tax=Kitasatospora sp. NBC_00315 TaxID=2975963 RepID=UPI00324B2D39
MSEFALRYETWFRLPAVLLGMGPGVSGVTVGAAGVTVRMGWVFRAEIPLSSITSAGSDGGRVGGWGVHGFGGRWLVNGSSRGLVRLRIEPDARAAVLLVPVRLRELRISVEQPQALLAALGRPA